MMMMMMMIMMMMMMMVQWFDDDLTAVQNGWPTKPTSSTKSDNMD